LLSSADWPKGLFIHMEDQSVGCEYELQAQILNIKTNSVGEAF
jgi:hypothetical protein